MGVPLGEVIYLAVKPMFKIYALIAIGFYLSRRNILSVDTTKNLSSIAIMVLLPSLMFNKIVTNIDNSDIAQIGTIAFLGLFNMFGGALLCFLAGLATRCPKVWYGGLISVGLFPNISDLPIAYLQSLEDSGILSNVDRGVSFDCIYTVIQVLFQFNLGLYRLIEFDFRDALKAANTKNLQDEEESPNGSDSTQELDDMDRAPTHTSDLSIDSSLDDNSDRGNHLRFLREKENSVRNTGSNTHRGLDLGRRDSVASATSNHSLRELPSENMADVVRQYSRFSELATGTVKMSDPADLQVAPKSQILSRNGFLGLFKSVFFLLVESLQKPISIAMIIAITICMIPWVKALFVQTDQAHISPAPDKLPPLSFIMDITSYIGAAQVPFGLLILGGTIGRLRIKNIPLSRWRTPLVVTAVRLVLLPVIGCALNSKVHKDGLFYNDPILYFVSNLVFCMPPATSNIYLTAFYTPPDYQDHTQVDCLAMSYICHYIALAICLPFTASYTLKVSLKY
ncbi:hypothetical protein OGAPHI_006948 [Ogataea philodendri]|uniref:Protein ECM3 n=1 Tax=Ogataea philodendri TaxID=1378263 RepID=A0A9P8NVF1_9ASCO|nr:uncharacterized protein OGAPHI_006948 [Ogataea philodendri]KAH3660362.1 hypothetical protein OGAPHI_006948 [Ogataea philodendri]